MIGDGHPGFFNAPIERFAPVFPPGIHVLLWGLGTAFILRAAQNLWFHETKPFALMKRLQALNDPVVQLLATVAGLSQQLIAAGISALNGELEER